MMKQQITTLRALVSAMLLLSTLLAGCAARSGFYHRVRKGETLYRISSAYQMPLEEVAHANNLRDYGALREGQYLLIPETKPEKAKPRMLASRGSSLPPRQHKVLAREREVEVPKRLLATNLSGRFAWPIIPANDTLVSREFGDFHHQHHTGIDLRAVRGTAVVAAAEGVVIYAGKGVAGFGKTVIVRHPEELFTVYSHLETIQVRLQQKLQRGQQLGTVGEPPEEHFGQRLALLHFEIRERTIPVDPQNILP